MFTYTYNRQPKGNNSARQTRTHLNSNIPKLLTLKIERKKRRRKNSILSLSAQTYKPYSVRLSVQFHLGHAPPPSPFVITNIHGYTYYTEVYLEDKSMLIFVTLPTARDAGVRAGQTAGAGRVQPGGWSRDDHH